MMVQAAAQQQLWGPGTTLPSKERQPAGQLDTSPMSLPADQRSPSAGTKAVHLEPAGSQLWTLPVPVFQEPAPLDSPLDEPLHSPFLHAMGAIGRPSVPSAAAAASHTQGPFRTSNSFNGSAAPASVALATFSSCSATAAQQADPTQPNTASSNGSSRRSFDVPQASPAGNTASTTKRVSWLDASTGFTKEGSSSFGTVHAGVLGVEGLSLAHGSPAHGSIWSNNGLLLVNSAPASSPGDLRDQGRLSCAGGVSALLLGAATHEAPEEACTPMQVNCISSLLGSLGTSLFSDALPATPPSRTAAGAAAAAAAKQTPILPDLVEEWEGRRSSSQSDTTGEAAAASATCAAASARSSSSSRRSSFASSAGSAFAGTNGPAASAAAAEAFPSSLGISSSSQAVAYPHTLAHAFSTPEPGRSAPNGAFSGQQSMAQHSTPPAQQQGFPAAAHTSAGPTRLQHARTIDSAAPAASSTFAPGLLSPTLSSAVGASNPQRSGAAPGQFIPSLSMPLSLQGMPSGLVAPVVYSTPAAAYAAMMQAQAYQQSTIAAAAAAAAAAGAPASVHQAWALAYLGATSTGAGGPAFPGPQGLLCHNPLTSWASQPAGGCFPLGAPDSAAAPPAQWRAPALQPSSSFGREQQPGSRYFPGRSRFFGSAAAISKADPKSLCGVDPRLCVGSPGDVEAEVCRRNPGLAELLRLPPHSVKLANVAVRPDTCPTELLASKRPDGPISPEELTIESGLLRHCFGLPSSIGPDLVRAARQSVTRPDAPGSGLEPFFWVLQAKLNWLLKRPVFFKGQLLRGQIHGITDHQRAASFAQVTEQRSKLGELLLVLYSMLAADCQPEA